MSFHFSSSASLTGAKTAASNWVPNWCYTIVTRREGRELSAVRVLILGTRETSIFCHTTAQCAALIVISLSEHTQFEMWEEANISRTWMKHGGEGGEGHAPQAKFSEQYWTLSSCGQWVNWIYSFVWTRFSLASIPLQTGELMIAALHQQTGQSKNEIKVGIKTKILFTIIIYCYTFKRFTIFWCIMSVKCEL